MKKQVVAVALAFGVSSAFAQDLTSKKGEPILPEAGDWAISMNADPIFQFVGNAFNGTSNSAAANTNWLSSSHTIIAKKFINEKSAYRAMVRLGFVNQTFKNMVLDDAQTGSTFVFPDVQGKVEDKYKHSSTNIAIGVGKEFRKGKTRLQGYYGADAMIWISSSKDKFTYGNKIAATTTTSISGESTTTSPTTTSWETDPSSANLGDTLGVASLAGLRPLISKSGMTFGIGVRGFIGAEYFLFPKIAIGAEYGWGIGFQTRGRGSKTSERYDAGTTAVGKEVDVVSGESKFGFDTDLNQGTIFGFQNSGTASLRVTFHF